MVDLLIALFAAAVYLAVGWRIAVRSLPRAWANARSHWSFEDSARESVIVQTVCMFLLWPVYLSIRTASARLGRVIDEGDPERLKDRIAELERELGIR